MRRARRRALGERQWAGVGARGMRAVVVAGEWGVGRSNCRFLVSR